MDLKRVAALLLLAAWWSQPVAAQDDSNNSTLSYYYGISEDLLSNITSYQLPWLRKEGFSFTDAIWSENVTCSKYVNVALRNATESGKADSQIATTLMAFIPSLITLGNLFVPRSSEAYATSFWVGFLSATYRLGLPVKSVSGVPMSQQLMIGTLDRTRLEQIYDWGAWASKGARFRLPWDTTRGPQAYAAELAAMRAWFDPERLAVRANLPSQLRPSAEKFLHLKRKVTQFSERHHRWGIYKHIAALVLFIGMFAVLWPAVLLLSVFPLWHCTEAGVLWLLVLAAISILVQTLMWELSSHERVLCWHLPSLRHARHLLPGLEQTEETVATHIPPLYSDLSPMEAFTRGLFKGWFRLRYVVTHPWQAMVSDSARRKPVVVLLYLNPHGQDPFIRIFTGFVQGLFLIFLTFFFGSFWGGSLKRVLTLLAIMLVVLTIGRLMGVLYIRWSASSYGLHVIECDDKIELRGAMRVLTCMGEEILVQINSALYVNGIRVDGSRLFQEYLDQLEMGVWDQEDSPEKVPRKRRWRRKNKDQDDAKVAQSQMLLEGDVEAQAEASSTAEIVAVETKVAEAKEQGMGLG